MPSKSLRPDSRPITQNQFLGPLFLFSFQRSSARIITQPEPAFLPYHERLVKPFSAAPETFSQDPRPSPHTQSKPPQQQSRPYTPSLKHLSKDFWLKNHSPAPSPQAYCENQTKPQPDGQLYSQRSAGKTGDFRSAATSCRWPDG